MRQDWESRTFTSDKTLKLLQFIHNSRVEFGFQDSESRAVSIAFEIVFDHDGVLYIVADVFGLVGFDAHFELLAESLPLAGERIIAISNVVAIGRVDDGTRRRGFVCCGHDVGAAALPGLAVSRRVVHAA